MFNSTSTFFRSLICDGFWAESSINVAECTLDMTAGSSGATDSDDNNANEKDQKQSPESTKSQ